MFEKVRSKRVSALKQPTRTAVALPALRSTIVPSSSTRWTLDPIIVTDRTLIRSHASFRANHAPANPVDELYVVAGCSALGTRRDWLRALHLETRLVPCYVSVTSMAGFDSF